MKNSMDWGKTQHGTVKISNDILSDKNKEIQNENIAEELTNV